MQLALIELRDFRLKTDIGTYSVKDTRPEIHLLDLTLGIAAHQVLISKDGMEYVFDYDPLIIEIERLASDGHYETQERLITRIASACASYVEIKTIEINLRKLPVRIGSGSLGLRLSMNEDMTNTLRTNSIHS